MTYEYSHPSVTGQAKSSSLAAGRLAEAFPMVALCRIELFGGLRIVQAEGTISRFRSQRTAGLLAFLAYHRDRAHPREAVIEMLWPWSDLAAGRHSLSTALSSLRHQLEPSELSPRSVLVADRTSVRLNPETVTTDVVEFEAALSAAQRAPDKAAKEMQLEEAIRLYRGELLPGLYEPWISSEQVRLSELYAGAVAELATMLAERGETAEAASHLRRAIEAEPFREDPYRQLIRLNVDHGEPHAALAVYRELERVLAAELGAKPSAATRKLVREIEQLQTPAAGPGLRSALSAPRPTRHRCKVEPPKGTVTFLLIRMDQDIGEGEPGSTHPLREEFKRHGGTEIENERAAYAVAFGRAGDALSCAATCQLRAAAPDPSRTPLAIAVHTAEMEEGPERSHSALHRTERLLAAAHPSQVLCSEATAGLLRYDLDGGLRLRDLGVYRLRGASASERLFQLDYPGGPEVSAPLDAEPGYSGHLPYQITRFFGRQQEIEQLEAVLIGDARLVTLVGPPGCGKTRLVIEAARRFVEPYKGNVWFVRLADLREGSDILDRALEPLGIQRLPQATPLGQIAAALAEQPSLIVFDNFEHLVESAGDVRGLLERLPDLRCLVTSRRRLGLAGEREFPVAPFPVPGEVPLPELLRNESVQLFVDRAQAVKPDFQLTPDNVETVAELCRRLEGVPLAIELAAARSQTHGLGRILAQLEKGEDLVTRSRDAEERHRSLRAAVEWSHSLLSPELQRFFARLSVFRGGWTVEAAEAVCEEPLASDYLMQLVESSLVQVSYEQEPRFRMLEMMRALALEHLEAAGEAESTKSRHLDHYHGLLHGLEGKWNGPDQKPALECIEIELDNFLAAMDWCDRAPKGVIAGLHLAGGLFWLWATRGYLRLGRAVLDRALRRDTSAAPAKLRADVLGKAGDLAFMHRDLTASLAMHEEALACWKAIGDRQGVAGSLHCIARTKIEWGYHLDAKQLLSEALALNEELANHEGVAANLSAISIAEFCIGNKQAARDLQKRCAAVSREHGNSARYYKALLALGELHWECGELSEAHDVLQRALTGHRELGNLSRLAVAQLSLSKVQASLDELESAKALFQEALPFVRKNDIRESFPFAVEAGAVLLMAQARNLAEAEARQALAKAATLISVQSRLGAKPKEASVPLRIDDYVPMLRSQLGDDAFHAAWRAGESITVEDALARLADWLEPTAPGAVESGRSREASPVK